MGTRRVTGTAEARSAQSLAEKTLRVLRVLRASAVTSVALALFGAGCSLLPPTTASGEAGNVIALGPVAYVSMGEAGFAVVDAPGGRTVRVVAPPAGGESVDDLAIADGLLFALDARAPGHLFVFSLEDPEDPRPVGPPVEVPVEPFSGVSAAKGRVVVSGGTKSLTVLSYDANGGLGEARTALDLGRGQPDVLLSPDGELAYVSTHVSLVRATYGVTVLKLAPPPAASAALGQVELDGAGFTPGAARPANFALEAALRGPTLFVAHGAGLGVLDVSAPADPRLVALLPLPVHAVNVDVRGSRAAVVGSVPSPTLVVVDVTDPARPRIERTVALAEGSRPTGVALTDAHIVVAGGPAGAIVLAR